MGLVRRKRKRPGLRKATVYYDKRTGKLYAKVGKGRLAYKKI